MLGSRFRFGVRCSLFVAAALYGSATTAQQPASQPPPTFRVDVDRVEVDAFVTDDQGQVVTNLTADDFEVREDGRAQKVASFGVVDIPISRVARSSSLTIEPDVAVNAPVEGRLYLLVLDDLHTPLARTAFVKDVVRRFIEQRFGDNDRAAVIFTGNQAAGAQEFTGSRRLLLAAVDKFRETSSARRPSKSS
jgi:VWFA-related protein